jgi:alpha-N-arabinofuranosidase
MPEAHITLDPNFTVGVVNRRLFGSFVEHLGRGVYGGIYEPPHPTADGGGFREDVIELVRELGVSAIRYPGGNFVSGYRWEDAIGPREDRPSRLDLAWHSTETNQVGIDEFSTWLEKTGSELMYAVNLGTRGVQDALDVLEYTNIRSGTALSEARISNGRLEPYGIKIWCLGNEMDGPWQLGHRSADDYGALASRTAKAMRQLDPSIELVVCGSSNAQMPTFGAWEHTVLKHTYDDIDFISCHAYYEEVAGDVESFLASAVNMDHFIESVISTSDAVGAELKSEKRINISFDEWNVWYSHRYENVEKITDIEHWPIAPRLLEDAYSVLDAVVVGNLLVSLLRHAGRVTAASLAQLVNVIAPIMTEPGGPAWRQTTFYPFALTSRLALGDALDLKIQSTEHETPLYGRISDVDCVATYDAASGATAIFLVNRRVKAPITVTIDVSRLSPVTVLETHTLTDDDIYAKNSLANPLRVIPSANHSANIEAGILSITLPAVSWTAVALGADPAPSL